jgi:N-acetylglucosaminyl-diphospho-decaprenol L-rhamnosyltransferase
MANTLDIIIVNWNSGPQLKACLHSLTGALQPVFSLQRVVIVDNASSDASVAGDFCPPSLPMTLIRNTWNRGFAAACNQGAAASNADFLLFLNPDTILESTSLNTPISFLLQPENSQIAICGIQLLDDQQNVSRTCARFPSPFHFIARSMGLDRLFPKAFPSLYLDTESHSHSHRVDHVIGAFFLVRRSVFQQLSGFDERFFVYLEDLDFSLRAKLAGWTSYFLASAQLSHRGGGCSEQAKANRLFYSLRSRLLYSFKHFSFMAATCVLFFTLFVEPFSRIALAAAHLSFAEMKETLHAYWLLWTSPSSMTSRSNRNTVTQQSLPAAVRSLPPQ